MRLFEIIIVIMQMAARKTIKRSRWNAQPEARCFSWKRTRKICEAEQINAHIHATRER